MHFQEGILTDANKQTNKKKRQTLIKIINK